MMRLFVGLALTHQIIATLSKLESGLPGARWIKPENFHVTLTFIGEVRENQAVYINESLSKIVMPGFDLTVEGLGTFGHARPHTLWAGVTLVPDLNRLQAKVTQCVSDLDIELERRKYTPHVTVARLHDTPIERLQTYLSGNSPFHGGTERALTFTLFESVLTKDGSAYHKLMEYPLV